MATYLNREAQFGIELQAAAGTAETLAAADYSQNSSNVSASVVLPKSDRGRNRGSLSRDAQVGKAKMQKISTTEELVGVAKTTNASDALIVHRCLRACGMQRITAQVQVVEVGAVTVGSGTVNDLCVGRRIGNNATEGSATKTGTLVHFKAGTPNKLWYVPGTGTFDAADTIHVYDAPAQSMPCDSSPADAGFEFRPKSETAAAANEIATVNCVKNGNRFQISDAMGDCAINLVWNEPAKFEFNFQGPFVPKDTSTDPHTAATSSPVASVPVVGGALAVSIGSPFHVARLLPTITSFSIKLGNTIAERRSAGVGSVYGSGYAGARISDRNITFSLDPEKPDLATEDYLKKLAGNTTFPLSGSVGDPADLNGMFIAFIPAAQLTGDYDEQEREGLAVVPLEGMATRFAADDDELRLFHITV